jgi:hypothetical protein
MAKSTVEHLSFRPAKGGVISELSMRTKRSGQGGGGMHDYESETTVHPTMEHAKAHLEKHMGDCFGGSEKSEASEGKNSSEM